MLILSYPDWLSIIMNRTVLREDFRFPLVDFIIVRRLV